MNRLLKIIALLVLTISTNPAHAKMRIAVLAFELNDITALPDTAEEQARTASMGPLLISALKHSNYDIVTVDAKDQASANANFGYLFHFDEAAVKLGKAYDADWIIVSQHSKPSFLFSYLISHLIDVKTGRQTANFSIELKGTHAKVTQHGVNTLARHIDEAIAKQAR